MGDDELMNSRVFRNSVVFTRVRIAPEFQERVLAKLRKQFFRGSGAFGFMNFRYWIFLLLDIFH